MNNNFIYLLELNINKSILLATIHNGNFMITNRELSKGLKLPMAAIYTMLKSLEDGDYIYVIEKEERMLLLTDKSIKLIKQAIKKAELYNEKIDLLSGI